MSEGGAALDPLLRPASVAIVGASRDPTKRGHRAVRALLDAHYGGEIYPVHPRGGRLFGLEVWPSLESLPVAADLALICTRAERVPDVVAACGARGIQGAVILAVGFRESGAAGAELERSTLEIARESSVRLIGPNTSGILNPGIGLNLVGAPPVPPGHLALLSQSGNVGLDIMTAARARGIGLSLYVGVGNESDIRFHEYLEYLEVDPDTHAVLIYAEGFRDPTSFLTVAARLNRSKPVLVLKGGRSERGGAAALSHTGAIAGSHFVLESLLRQRGIATVRRSDELLALGEALGGQPPTEPGRKTLVLSDGGGHATLAIDALAERGIELAQLSSSTLQPLRELLGPAAAVRNPVDLAGAADRSPAVFAKALELCLSAGEIGAVLITGLFGGYAIRFEESLLEEETEAARQLVDACRRASVPLIVHSLYAGVRSNPIGLLRDSGVPVTASVDSACEAIRSLAERGRGLAPRTDAVMDRVSPGPRGAAVIRTLRDAGRTAMTEVEGRALLEEQGVTFHEARLCTDEAEVGRIATELDETFAMKLVSSTILHKTDAGVVELGLRGAEEALVAFAVIRNRAAGYALRQGIDPDFQGVLISPMATAPIAELIVGCRRDPQYGPVLVVGAGGLAVELEPDRSLRGLPIGTRDVREMIDELRIACLLHGSRGRSAADLASVTNLCASLAGCLEAYPELDEIELNPVFAYTDGCLALDVLGFLR